MQPCCNQTCEYSLGLRKMETMKCKMKKYKLLYILCLLVFVISSMKCVLWVRQKWIHVSTLDTKFVKDVFRPKLPGTTPPAVDAAAAGCPAGCTSCPVDADDVAACSRCDGVWRRDGGGGACTLCPVSRCAACSQTTGECTRCRDDYTLHTVLGAPACLTLYETSRRGLKCDQTAPDAVRGRCDVIMPTGDQTCTAFTGQKQHTQKEEETLVDVWACSEFIRGEKWQHPSCKWSEKAYQSKRGNIYGVPDPGGGNTTVLGVFYPAGRDSMNGNSFVQPLPGSRSSLYLEYDIYFASADGGPFPWVLGGKLPGLYGGDGQCSGGVKQNCFSTRFMWRQNGDMELYAYLPGENCDWLCNHSKCPYNCCNFGYGHSLGRGAARLQSGRWHKLRQYVRLNDVGHRNGIARYWMDGDLKYEMKGLVFRNQNITIDRLYFSTFFGGAIADWYATEDCYTYYRNFRVSSPDNKQL